MWYFKAYFDYQLLVVVPCCMRVVQPLGDSWDSTISISQPANQPNFPIHSITDYVLVIFVFVIFSLSIIEWFHTYTTS